MDHAPSPDASDLILRPAALDDGLEIWSMIQEIGPGENGFHNSGHGVPFSHFQEFLRRKVDEHNGRDLSPGYVPQTTYWAFVAGRPVGISKLRHELTAALRVTGGHIGYAIRPSERGRGYGTVLLKRTLAEAARLGLASVLITVNEENQRSWRLVETNGGTLSKNSDGKRYYLVPTRTG